MCFHLCAYWLAISVFKMVPKHSAEVLAKRLHKTHHRATTCLREKIGVLDKLRSGMTYGAIGCESSVNASTIYIT